MESNFEWITANGDIGIRFFHSIDEGGYLTPPHWHNDLEIIYILEGRLKVRFGDGGERMIGENELIVINSGTIHAITAYPNQGIVLQVPYELLLQYMEHYDQLYFVVDARPDEEEKKRKLSELKAIFREMDAVYGARKEGYLLKFDSLLLEALFRLQTDYAVRIGKEHIPQNQKAVLQICEVMRYIEEHYAEKLTVAHVAEHFGYTPNYLSKLLKRYLGLTVYQYLYEIRLDRICRDLQRPGVRIMELLPRHGCENYKSVSRLFKERYGCSMKEMQKRYEKEEEGNRSKEAWMRIRKAKMP